MRYPPRFGVEVCGECPTAALEPALLVMNGPDIGRVRRIDSGLCIGTKQDCDVRVHPGGGHLCRARVRRIESQLYLHSDDAELQVNDTRRPRGVSHLRANDKLRIGGSLFKVLVGSEEIECYREFRRALVGDRG